MPSITIGVGGGVSGLQALGEPLAAVVTSEEVSRRHSKPLSPRNQLQPIPTPSRTTLLKYVMFGTSSSSSSVVLVLGPPCYSLLRASFSFFSFLGFIRWWLEPGWMDSTVSSLKDFGTIISTTMRVPLHRGELQRTTSTTPTYIALCI